MQKMHLGIAAACAFVLVAVAFPMLVTASPQTDVFAAQPALQATPTVNASFAPAKRTIWQAEPQLDQMDGACTGHPINYCAQLVALTPQGRGMSWRGQELRPYFMTRIKPNIYVYNGLNSLRDGRVKLTLEFTSPTTWKATQVLTLKSQPGCTHTLHFTGTFLR